MYQHRRKKPPQKVSVDKKKWEGAKSETCLLKTFSKDNSNEVEKMIISFLGALAFSDLYNKSLLPL